MFPQALIKASGKKRRRRGQLPCWTCLGYEFATPTTRSPLPATSSTPTTAPSQCRTARRTPTPKCGGGSSTRPKTRCSSGCRTRALLRVLPSTARCSSSGKLRTQASLIWRRRRRCRARRRRLVRRALPPRLAARYCSPRRYLRPQQLPPPPLPATISLLLGLRLGLGALLSGKRKRRISGWCRSYRLWAVLLRGQPRNLRGTAWEAVQETGWGAPD